MSRVGKRILVVDDEQRNRELLEGMLEILGYQAEFAGDGLEALAKVRLGVDLVLLDLMMPGMDGFEVAQRIREHQEYRDLPIIVVTGLDGKDVRLRAVEAGVNDFIGKPLEMAELKVRLASQLRLKEATDALKRSQSDLEEQVERRTADLRRALEDMLVAQRLSREAHLDTIRRLVLAAEYKDRDTAAHIQRIGDLGALIARELGRPAAEVALLRQACQMHDVGKLGIPDAILLKPGKLDAEERRVMEQHTVIGARILEGSPSALLQAGEIIALSHHERWDGGGYPHRLGGEDIPLWGRICAVGDFFDALTTDRPYRAAVSEQETLAMMQEQRGKHFAPELLDVFFSCLDEVRAIKLRWDERELSGLTGH